MKPLMTDDIFHTSHLSNPLGVNLQLLLELADGSVLLLQLLHEILKQDKGWRDKKRRRERGEMVKTNGKPVPQTSSHCRPPVVKRKTF